MKPNIHRRRILVCSIRCGKPNLDVEVNPIVVFSFLSLENMCMLWYTMFQSLSLTAYLLN